MPTRRMRRLRGWWNPCVVYAAGQFPFLHFGLNVGARRQPTGAMRRRRRCPVAVCAGVLPTGYLHACDLAILLDGEWCRTDARGAGRRGRRIRRGRDPGPCSGDRDAAGSGHRIRYARLDQRGADGGWRRTHAGRALGSAGRRTGRAGARTAELRAGHPVVDPRLRRAVHFRRAWRAAVRRRRAGDHARRSGPGIALQHAGCGPRGGVAGPVLGPAWQFLRWRDPGMERYPGRRP